MMPRIHLLLLWGLVLAQFVLGAAFYPFLPNPAPIHWNIRGQADGFGPPWVDAGLFPIVSLVLAALLVLLPRLGPLRTNFEKFARTYGRIAVTFAAAFLAIELVLLLKATGHAVPIERALPAIVGLLIAAMGNWMGKVRRNYYVGIRTPWTLASDAVWERTHRAGGWVMVAYGLATLLAAAVAPPWAILTVILGGALGLVAWSLGYSCYVFHHLGPADGGADGAV